MFSHIIGNPILVSTPQNTWKHHITRLDEVDKKMTALLAKLHGQNKGGLGPSCTWIKWTKASSWCFKGSSSSTLAETCTTSLLNAYSNAFALNLVMGPLGTCNGSLVFMDRSISSPLSLKGFDLESKPVSNKVWSATLKVALTLI